MGEAEQLLISGAVMTLRDVTPADSHEVLRLHQRVFGSTADEAWFAWKYGQGGGAGVAVGAWCDGILVAHCGGLPRTMLSQGVLQHNLQIGDVMVDPAWRGLLTRHGPFYHVSKRLYASRLGRDRPYHLGFGFPNARALSLGVKSGLSWDVGQMMELRWQGSGLSDLPAGSGAGNWLWSARKLGIESAGFDAAVDSVWRRMQVKMQGLVVGERHAAYVRWRFAKRPGHDSVFLQVSRPWQSKALGVCVLSLGLEAQPWLHWLDWIGPPELMAVACALCRAEAARAGALGLTAWASAPVLAYLKQTGVSAQSEAARISVAAASAVSLDDARRAGWWLMGGDTDFL